MGGEIPGLNLFIIRNGTRPPPGWEDSSAWAAKKEEIRHWLVARRLAFREAPPMIRVAAETCERILDSDPETSQCRTGRVLLSLAEALEYHEWQVGGLPPLLPPETIAAPPTPEVLYWQIRGLPGDETNDGR